MFCMPDLPNLNSIHGKPLPAIERHYNTTSDSKKIDELVKIIDKDSLEIKKQTFELLSEMDGATSSLINNITAKQYKHIINDYINNLYSILKNNSDTLKSNIKYLEKQKKEFNKLKGSKKNIIISSLASFIKQMETAHCILNDTKDKLDYITKDHDKLCESNPQYQQLKAYKSAIKQILNIDIEPIQFGKKIDNVFVFEIPRSILDDSSVKNRLKISDKIHDMVFAEKKENYTASIAIDWI